MKLLVFLSLLSVSFIGISQSNLESPMEKCNFIRSSIQKHKIRSVLVFAEIGYDGDFEDGIISGKAREYEFDESGNVIYKISSYDDGYYPLAEFGRGSEIEYSNYNEQNLRTFFCQENFRRISEYFSEFDSNGNLLLTEKITRGSNISGHDKQSFKWENGKMVKSEFLLPIKTERGYVANYDEKGRCLEVVGSSYKTTNVYTTNGDTLIQKQSYSRADTCVRFYTNKHLKQFPEQNTYFCQQDCDGKIISEFSLDLDLHGNPIKYSSLEFTTVQDEMEFSTVQIRSHTQIKNTYDERGLLVKQAFFKIDESTSEKKLFKVYRYVYESTPLIKKFEKGELREKEIEMNESYGPDY